MRLEPRLGKLGAAIFAGMHMGNCEIGVWPLNFVCVRPAGVYPIVENPYVNRYIHRQRSSIYPGGLFASKGDERFFCRRAAALAASLAPDGTISSYFASVPA